MYKVPYKVYQVCWGKISRCEEGRRGREYHGCGEEYNVEKRERGSNIIFPIIMRQLGRISSGEKGKEMEISGMKIKIKKNGGGEKYQVVENFIHPWIIQDTSESDEDDILSEPDPGTSRLRLHSDEEKVGEAAKKIKVEGARARPLRKKELFFICSR